MESAAEALLMKGNKSGYFWVFNSNENAIRFYKKLGGVQTDYSMKEIFGHKVFSRKFEWEDLSTIVRKKLNINYQQNVTAETANSVVPAELTFSLHQQKTLCHQKR